MKPSLGLYCLTLLLVGCADARWHGSAGDESFERILAPASAERPRQTEGDIVVLRDGTLLAAWSDFSGQGQDHSTAVISAARSLDGGRAWGPPYTLQPNIGKQNVMSVSFLRLRGSRDILFFFLVKNSATDLKVWLRRSSDEARSWSEPLVVTPGPGYHIMNNARVIQLRSGRLLCPVCWCENIARAGSTLRNLMFASDDQGRTWTRGGGMVECPKRGAMEPGVVELKDGRVLQVIRTQMGQIWFSYSKDEGDTWSVAEPSGIVSPESPSTIARLPGTGALLLVHNPKVDHGISAIGSRTPLVARISRDEGKSWSEARVIEPGLSSTYAYTSVTFDRDRALLTYWSAPSTNWTPMSLKFKSLPLGWLSQEPGSDR
jgi:sialidase-1